MSLPKPPNHNNNCIKCGNKITTFHKTTNSAGTAEVAFCDECYGYPCYCNRKSVCNQGSFLVSTNPLKVSIACPSCSHWAALVQIKDGWW